MSKRRSRTPPESSLDVARRVIQRESRTLARMARHLGPEFDRVVELCLQCRGRVVLSGMGKSGLICRKIVATLASTGTASFFMHPADALHGDLGMLLEQDVAVLLSHGGETKEILALVPSLRRLGLPIVAVTGKPASRLGALADVVLEVPVKVEADPFGFIPTASTTGALALGDALAVALLVRRGFREEDFALNHPGGSLGRGLLKVRKVMHAGSAVPSVGRRTLMKDAVRVMSEKGLGLTAVVDARHRLLGVVTDGDLRRGLEAGEGFLEEPVGRVMTKSPKTIRPDELCAKALHQMEAHHITALLVTDEGDKLLGVLHLHALWKTELF